MRSALGTKTWSAVAARDLLLNPPPFRGRKEKAASTCLDKESVGAAWGRNGDRAKGGGRGF
jgi:hypothetical protein